MQYNDRIDAYIAKSADFAKPILTHLRDLMHRAAPEITESIKWSMPFFDYKGPVANLAAFKQHCAFGFWKASLLTDTHGILGEAKDAMGSLGRITSVADLPDDEILISYIHQAIALNEAGVKTEVRKHNTEKKELEVPDYFIVALSTNPNAMAHFENFSPSKKKEYIEWITEAKTEATRQKRLEIALEWISEGKSRHWKYK